MVSVLHTHMLQYFSSDHQILYLDFFLEFSSQVTHHHTPLIAATIANKANRAATKLPSATHRTLSSPKTPKSEDLFVTEEEIKIHLGFAECCRLDR